MSKPFSAELRRIANRKPTTGKPKVTLFEVRETWVKVRFKFVASFAEELLQRKQSTVSNYGRDVFTECIPCLWAIDRGEPCGSACKRLRWEAELFTRDMTRGRKLAEFTVTMKQSQWSDVCRVAEAFGVKPDAIACAVLWRRLLSLRRLDKQRVEGGGQ